MASYGNILAIFGSDTARLEELENMLSGRNLEFHRVDNLFFLKTRSKINTRALVDEIAAQEVEFLFFHNHNCDGSVIKSNIGHASYARVKQILLTRH